LSVLISASSWSASASTPARSHRAQTITETHYLVGLAALPAGHQRTGHVPPGLRRPVLGEPVASSLVDAARFWLVPMSFDAAVRWIRHVEPRGLALSESSSGVDRGIRTTAVGFDAPDSAAWVSAELEYSVTSLTRSTTEWRIDGIALPLDPRPIPDDQPGPRLGHSTPASCPSGDGADVGVQATPLTPSGALVPPIRPSAALLCRYSGLNDPRPFTLDISRAVNATRAVAISERAAAIQLGHVDGAVSGCPADFATAWMVVLSYPDGSESALWYADSGCQHVANGRILADYGAAITLFGRELQLRSR
jgi:hypothetical protein